MLPVMIYDQDEGIRGRLEALILRSSGDLDLKIVLSTGTLGILSRTASAASGAEIVILGLSFKPADDRSRGLQLGRTLSQQNRDAYLVYLIHDMVELPSLLPQCARPSGILLGDFTDAQAGVCFERIAEDYQSAFGHPADGAFLTLEIGQTVHRLSLKEVIYIEALNKKLNICTRRQTFTVRRSLQEIEKQLPPEFIRCHRSCIANCDQVEAADYRDMTLRMRDGSLLPIARSNKEALRRRMSGEGEVIQ